MTAIDAGSTPGHPVEEFDNWRLGPVLSHVEGIDALRERHAFMRSTFGPGFWVLSDSDLIREAMQRPDLFSSSVVVPLEPDPPYKWIPEMLDPPEHTAWRQLLAPHFAPKPMERLEAAVTERCIELIEPLAAQGQCDFLQEFAYRYPTTIFMELMGLPREGLDQFLEWVHEILHLGTEQDPDRSRAFNAMLAVMGYFGELTEAKRREPGDDLLSASLSWEINGEPISQDDRLSWCLLMFMAGLDTVSIQLGYAFWYLASHPTDRRLLVDDPALVGPAVEEFLRYFAFVAPARKVMQDIDFHGCPMHKGDMVLVPLSSATRDPKIVEDPVTVRFDRETNNHIAFGLGPHRCLGSHLARRELRVAIEQWHARIPEYRLTDGIDVTEHGGMYGLDSLHLSWG